jgi:hypothetical protein
MIRFQCGCGKRLKVDDAHVGRKVRCAACGVSVTVPAASSAAIPSAAVSSPSGGQAAARPGQGRRSPALPGSKLPLYIGLGVAGGVTLIVLVVCIIMASGNSRQEVKPPVTVKIPPTTTQTSGKNTFFGL